MDEDRLNMEVRKFLKAVGVTSQREIEAAVREAVSTGKIKPDATLAVKMTLRLPGIGLQREIDGAIALG
jgi:tRNA(Ser,Leu) C12 N-acetylase TAN1